MTPNADPVAWQNRYRSRSGPSEEWSEWSEWRDGKQPELRTKTEGGGCYDTEERPLHTRPDPKLAEAAEELLRFIDDQDYGDLPDELKGRIRAVLGREP